MECAEGKISGEKKKPEPDVAGSASALVPAIVGVSTYGETDGETEGKDEGSDGAERAKSNG